MSMMRLIVLRQYTKFEIPRPSDAKDVADLSHDVKRPEDLVL